METTSEPPTTMSAGGGASNAEFEQDLNCDHHQSSHTTSNEDVMRENDNHDNNQSQSNPPQENEMVMDVEPSSLSSFGHKNYTPISLSEHENENENAIREVNSGDNSGEININSENENDSSKRTMHENSYQSTIAYARRAERDYINIRNAIDLEEDRVDRVAIPHPQNSNDGNSNSNSNNNSINLDPSSNDVYANNTRGNNNNNNNNNDNNNVDGRDSHIDAAARELLLQLARDYINQRFANADRANDNNNDNNVNDNDDNNVNDNVEMGMFGRRFNLLLLRRMVTLNRKHPFRDFLIFLYVTSAIVVPLMETNIHCEPSLRVWIIIMGVYVFIRCMLYITSRSLKRRIIQADLAGNRDPYIWSRRLYTFEMRLMELLDVFGVITFCVGNLMVIRAQQCYHEAPISTWSGLILVLLTNGCLLYPFCKKLSALCGNDPNHHHDPNGNEIPPALRLHLSRSREDVKRAWTQWLETNGSRSFDYCPEAIRDESITEYTYGDEEPACPICLDDFKGCDNVRVQSFPCPSRHIFHEQCLLDFLYSVSGRDTMPSCPCCRASAGERRDRSRSSGTEEVPIAASIDENDNNDNNGSNNDRDHCTDENKRDNITNTNNECNDNDIAIDVVEGSVMVCATSTSHNAREETHTLTSDGINQQSVPPLLPHPEESLMCCGETPTGWTQLNTDNDDAVIAASPAYENVSDHQNMA